MNETIDRIYAVETKDYEVILREIELSCPVPANSTPAEYKTKCPVYLEPDAMTNTIPASRMECVIPLQMTAYRPYHIITYFSRKEDRKKHLRMARNARNERLDNDINDAKSKYIKLMRIKEGSMMLDMLQDVRNDIETKNNISE